MKSEYDILIGRNAEESDQFYNGTGPRGPEPHRNRSTGKTDSYRKWIKAKIGKLRGKYD